MIPEVEKQAEFARVFFALWPSVEDRAALIRSADVLHGLHGGRRMRPDSLHLTLVFIGRLETSRIPELVAVAHESRPAPFEVVFDQRECWRHNRIVCLSASQIPPALLELVRALESGLEERGIPFDKRPYKPHVTLLRNGECHKASKPGGGPNENPALEPVRWLARDYVLVKSSLRPDGARYEELGRWPLL